MIAVTRYLILTTVLAGILSSVQGQSSFASFTDSNRKVENCKPPINRQIFHDYVRNEQTAILNSDGKKDKQFTPSNNPEVNLLLTRNVVGRIDLLRCSIESDSTFNHATKVRYLRGIENILKFYVQNKSNRKINPLVLPDIITAYEQAIKVDREGKSIEQVVNPLSYEVANSLVNADRVTFEKNPGIRSSRDLVILKYCHVYPSRTFQTLKENPDVSFADSLVRVVAKRYPRQLYDYAAANNRLGYIIRNIKDDLFVRTVAQMATSKSGQQYFPFLDNIVSGKMTISDIDQVKNDSVLYYRLLVNTHMEYVNRAMNKDTAFEYKALTQRMEAKAKEIFINTINALHDERNHDIRFKCIQPLNAQELYYLAVSSDGLIYTSSFVKGVYPLMMKKINNRGDSLLMLVNFDRYRKLIKMSAGFNTLDHFLGSFPKSSSPGEEDPANTLMRAFVKNLEKSDGLEDGVDVADSYASISETLKPVAADMLKNIQDNYQRNVANNNRKGMAIYDILSKLFLSADSTQKIDLTKELGIPPVYEVPFTGLASDSGRVNIQVFIYGDKDGIGVFPTILGLFRDANWKIDQSNKQWVTINSVTGRPVTLYLNRPLPEDKGEDAEAQKALCEYLEKKHIVPTVTVNRGHSYNAPYTINQMSTASKIVFMGSCGGYRMIHDILEKAPDAHIIGTKQIADAPVNNPFLKLIANKLRTGGDIQWIPFWKELEKVVTDKTIFVDYVPPHKNLGALFIKAYRKAMGEDDKI
jgi:hypothetical protein